MTISVLSQYLYHVIEKLPQYRHNAFLRIIYLVEAFDYHKRNLDFAQRLEPSEFGWMRGVLQAPDDWETSLDIEGSGELSHYWSYLVSIIEFEAFLSAVVRFSDVTFFNLLNNQLINEEVEIGNLTKKEAGYIKNIGSYSEKKNKPKYKFLKENPYNIILEEAWKDWLEDLTSLRNLITHKVSFGGRTWPNAQIPSEGGLYSVLLLPNFSDIKSSNVDIENIFNISVDQNNFNEILERNSKAYSDTVHVKVHELVNKLLLVEAS